MTNPSSWNDKSTTSENDKSSAAQWEFLPAGGVRAVYRLLARDTHTESHYFALFFTFILLQKQCMVLQTFILSLSFIYLLILFCCITEYSDDGDDDDNVKRKHSATVDLGQVCQNAKA